MAFNKVGTLTPYGAPVLRYAVITNSTTMTVQDMVGVTSGFLVDASGTTNVIFGNLDSFATNKGVGVITTGVAGAALGSFVGTYTTASNNQTVGLVNGVVDVSKGSLYSNPTDGVLGTTTGSNLLGYYLNLATGSATTISETSATTTRGTTSFVNHGLLPGSTTLIVVSLGNTILQS